MKKLFLCGALAVSALFMTSCLGEGSNEISDWSYGVISNSDKTYKTIIKSNRYGPLYSQEIASNASILPRQCCFFSFTLNRDLPENSSEAFAANGYYTISSLDGYIDITRYTAVSHLTDTTTLLPEELTVSSIDLSRTGMVDNIIFLPTNHEGFMQDQKQRFEISYDANQEPEQMSEGSVYELVLRVIKTDEGKSPSGIASLINAFDISHFITTLGQKEKSAGSKELKFRFKYIKKIDEENNSKEWKFSEVITYQLNTEEV